jgi:flagellar biosynthesis protein FliQ
MTLDSVTEIINGAVQTVIIGSMPSVALGLIIGLIIAVFQAVTQIQEQTLTFVPKMVVVLLVFGWTFPWLGRMLTEFAYNLWNNIPLYAQ